MTCKPARVDVYQLSFDLKPDVRDTELVDALDGYLGMLQTDGRIDSWRLLRRKLGLGTGPEFELLIETRDLAQLDEAFRVVASRTDPVEERHHAVNSLVVNFAASLYRDFPDPERERGAERF